MIDYYPLLYFMPIRYISSRGNAKTLNFEEVLLTGLASDGGLYMPESLPFFSPEQILGWQNLPYDALAFEIMYPFVEGCIPADDFQKIIQESYASFRHPAIAPLIQTGRNEWVLELFHGPTLAFKDFALQLLGRLLDYVLAKRQERIVIMGATSGDTGSAAIEGCRYCDQIDIFILHPHGRISDVQRKQMTSVLADNVYNIAVEGNFDDCQEIVKASFRNQDFLKGRKLVAVNSINWARIMAQIVYYFYASLSIGATIRSTSYAVPTGNFGDILAGYLARKMGLPIEKLVIATNKNDILHRTLETGHHQKNRLEHTLSPSMDIMVSSNFERLLFDLYERDAPAIASMMEQFRTDGVFTINETVMHKLKALFASHAVNDEDTCRMIELLYQQTGQIMDPHSAIGVCAARQVALPSDHPVVVLATAHPAKFPEAVVKAGLKQADLPHHLLDLMGREERYDVLPNDLSTIQQYVAQKSKLA